MASFLHTCSSCGAQMQVHERYLGQTLKCTTCRVEFVAEMPAEGLREVAPTAAAPRSAAIRSEPDGRRFLLLLLVVPILGALFWFTRGEEAPQTTFRDGYAVGEVASLDTGTSRPVLVALDQASVGALVDMRTGAIQLGVSSLMTNQDRYLELDAGTRVRVLAYANEDREAKVRVLEGPSTEQVVWVPRRWLR